VQQRNTRIPVLCALWLLLGGCELEQALFIGSDGSGSCDIRICIDRNVAATLPDIRHKAETEGYHVVAEHGTASQHVLVVRKEFRNVTELDGDLGTFRLTVTRRGLLRRDYQLTAVLAPLAIERQFTIMMPGRITSTSAGTVDGSRLQWRTRGGGTLQVATSAISVDRTVVLIALGVALLIAGVSWIAWSISRRIRPGRGLVRGATRH
jgi:hypothetical protein